MSSVIIGVQDITSVKYAINEQDVFDKVQIDVENQYGELITIVLPIAAASYLCSELLDLLCPGKFDEAHLEMLKAVFQTLPKE